MKYLHTLVSVSITVLYPISISFCMLIKPLLMVIVTYFWVYSGSFPPIVVLC
jgi:hypothetical protein